MKPRIRVGPEYALARPTPFAPRNFQFSTRPSELPRRFPEDPCNSRAKKAAKRWRQTAGYLRTFEKNNKLPNNEMVGARAELRNWRRSGACREFSFFFFFFFSSFLFKQVEHKHFLFEIEIEIEKDGLFQLAGVVFVFQKRTRVFPFLCWGSRDVSKAWVKLPQK